MKAFSVAHLAASLEAKRQEIEKNIVIDDGFVTVRYGGYDYNIDLEGIESEKDLLRWVMQLLDKTWMNMGRVSIFAEIVAEHKGWHIR